MKFFIKDRPYALCNFLKKNFLKAFYEILWTKYLNFWNYVLFVSVCITWFEMFVDILDFDMVLSFKNGPSKIVEESL